MPEPEFVRACLEAVDIRVHQDIILNTSTLADAREAVIVLPAMTRYEQPGGGTSTSTERMVYFSPEIAGPRIGEARAEWQIYGESRSTGLPGAQAANSIQETRRRSARRSRGPHPTMMAFSICEERAMCSNMAAPGCARTAICPTPDGRGTFIADRAAGAAQAGRAFLRDDPPRQAVQLDDL